MLTIDAITERRNRQEQEVAQRVVFRVKALYGLSRGSVSMPLNKHESIDSGQVCITIDPDSDEDANVGVIDYTHSPGRLKVRYAVQAVFPGLYDLVRRGRHDATLLFPVRVTATDDCTITPDLNGWHALGCLEFLPGSIWAGAGGG